MLWSPRAFASRSGGWPKGHLLPNLCSLRERSKRRMKRRNFAMCAAFPPSDYYKGSAPPRTQQPTVGLPATGLAGREGGRANP